MNINGVDVFIGAVVFAIILVFLAVVISILVQIFLDVISKPKDTEYPVGNEPKGES